MYAKLVACALLLCCSALLAEEFLLRLVLVNSHTEDVWLGCKTGASKKYDRGEDIFAPPPGMQTGMVTMPSPGGRLPTLYKDVRAPELPQHWELNCQPFVGKAIELSWDTSKLPASITLTMAYRGKTLNMREISTLSIVQSTTVVVTASANPEATAPPGNAVKAQYQRPKQARPFCTTHVTRPKPLASIAPLAAIITTTIIETVMKEQAVIFGAGNIGRGFIGQLFAESGYEVIFVDVDQDLIAALNRDHYYHLQTVSNAGVEDNHIGPVSALNGADSAAVAQAIASASIAATAVGANALRFVAPNLAAGLALRAADSAGPLNIIVCENLHGAAQHLRDLTAERISEPTVRDYLANSVGYVDTVIGRMVPAPTPAMRAADVSFIKVEPYKELPVDRSGFVGTIPTVSAMHAEDNFGVYTARKLYVHNCGHALLAYVGYQRGYSYSYEAMADDDIRTFMLAGLRESVDGICAKFGADPAWLYSHVDDLLLRFANRQLGDTLYRLGRDPLRKLAAEDRLTGAANLACAAGLAPRHLAWGIAAALLFAPADDTSAQELQRQLREQGVAATIAAVAGIAPDSALSTLVQDAYAVLRATPTALPKV